MSCVSTSSISILINGGRSSPLKPSSIRQGDPMSSYLFILCMERLSRSIELNLKDKSWTPVKITHWPKLSHIFFAEDLTVFAKPTMPTSLPFSPPLCTYVLNLAKETTTTSSRPSFPPISLVIELISWLLCLEWMPAPLLGNTLGFPWSILGPSIVTSSW